MPRPRRYAAATAFGETEPPHDFGRLPLLLTPEQLRLLRRMAAENLANMKELMARRGIRAEASMAALICDHAAVLAAIDARIAELDAAGAESERLARRIG